MEVVSMHIYLTLSFLFIFYRYGCVTASDSISVYREFKHMSDLTKDY